MKKIVIIGGGVAGLSALNRLADLGIAATLVEGGDYPSHKICGEFFSPESLPILAEWGLCPAAEIKQISFLTATSALHFPLSHPAGGATRYDFDFQLAKRAREKGARILTKTRVEKIEKRAIHLDSGEVLDYSDVIISAGRFFKSASPAYVGIKGHLKGLEIGDRLEMFPFHGGYAGLSPIGGGCANFACLLHQNGHLAPTPLQSVFQFAPHLEKRLKGAELVFKEWMVSPVPPFGMKKRAPLSQAYFIGDAAGTIPPASGLGLSLAITSGYMVADYALKGDDLGFHQAWKSKYRRVFLYGQGLHRMMMHPALFRPAMEIGRRFSPIGPLVFKMSRIF